MLPIEERDFTRAEVVSWGRIALLKDHSLGRDAGVRIPSAYGEKELSEEEIEEFLNHAGEIEELRQEADTQLVLNRNGVPTPKVLETGYARLESPIVNSLSGKSWRIYGRFPYCAREWVPGKQADFRSVEQMLDIGIRLEDLGFYGHFGYASSFIETDNGIVLVKPGKIKRGKPNKENLYDILWRLLPREVRESNKFPGWLREVQYSSSFSSPLKQVIESLKSAEAVRMADFREPYLELFRYIAKECGVTLQSRPKTPKGQYSASEKLDQLESELETVKGEVHDMLLDLSKLVTGVQPTKQPTTPQSDGKSYDASFFKPSESEEQTGRGNQVPDADTTEDDLDVPSFLRSRPRSSSQETDPMRMFIKYVMNEDPENYTITYIDKEHGRRFDSYDEFQRHVRSLTPEEIARLKGTVSGLDVYVNYVEDDEMFWEKIITNHEFERAMMKSGLFDRIRFGEFGTRLDEFGRKTNREELCEVLQFIGYRPRQRKHKKGVKIIPGEEGSLKEILYDLANHQSDIDVSHILGLNNITSALNSDKRPSRRAINRFYNGMGLAYDDLDMLDQRILDPVFQSIDETLTGDKFIDISAITSGKYSPIRLAREHPIPASLAAALGVGTLVGGLTLSGLFSTHNSQYGTPPMPARVPSASGQPTLVPTQTNTKYFGDGFTGRTDISLKGTRCAVDRIGYDFNVNPTLVLGCNGSKILIGYSLGGRDFSEVYNRLKGKEIEPTRDPFGILGDGHIYTLSTIKVGNQTLLAYLK